ncbi:MAG: hypothetical protein D4R80_04730 [Deltaproteobacteria bacterium]|nr:MAG: hypothetical protein D4R80_04730 [Deltaproteobacteria bacterium]
MKTFLLFTLLLCTVAVPPAGAADLPHPVLDPIAANGKWKLLEPVRTFGPDNLYEEINGEAELVLPYGMKRLAVAVLGRTARPGSEVRLEIYEMASSRDAYGIWSQYRYPDQELLPIPPSEAIVSDTSADFFRGDTFVRIRSKPGDGSRSEVVGISTEIVALLAGSASPPEEARALDDLPGRVAGSILYQKRAMLGYECLAPGFEVKFSTTTTGHYLLLPSATDGGAGRKARLARELPEYREVNPTLFNAQTPSGELWMTPEGGCVLAVAGKIPREQAGPLLSSFAQRLRGMCRPTR